ncbi:MAG: hypothetical protein ABIZ34_10125, partial [Candidatus Limnocylindrales bacterium]
MLVALLSVPATGGVETAGRGIVATRITGDGVPTRVVALRQIADGFVKPVFLTHAFDGRLFVVEQGGRIRI